MYRNTYILIAISILLIGMNFSCVNRYHKINDSIDVVEAKSVTYKELENKGLNPDEMNIVADKKNKIWRKYVSEDPTVLEFSEVKAMDLAQKKYWAVYFYPKAAPGEYILGGDGWVFIDSNNGNVLGVIRSD